jgi:predicted negative regulator of RcsB-dependent stress response
LAKMSKRKARIRVKDMKFRNDPMIRLYDKTQDWLQERGRPLVIAVGVLAGLFVLYMAGDYFFEYRASKAGEEFAKAYEKYSAQVVDTQTTTQVGRYYTDEKQKWQESAEAFEHLAHDNPGYYGGIGRYYAGISYLHFDTDKGLQLLQEAIQKGDPQIGDQARLALAEHFAATGDDVEKAASHYESLLNSSFVPHQVVRLGLGKLYEASGDTEKAVEAYFEAAKIDRETGQSSDAEKRLSALAPDRVKDLPASTPSLPTP